MTKIVAFREPTWLSTKTDFRQWDHLCRAYSVDLQMVDSWSEADVPSGYRVAIMDEDGTQPLESFLLSLKAQPFYDIVYVFGRTGMNLMSEIPSYDHSIYIDTPNKISLFGISAGSILLYSLYELK